MISDIVNLIVFAIITERITEILVDSEIFAPIRVSIHTWAFPDEPPDNTYTQRFKIWFAKLTSCGYCSSVWVGGLLAFFLQMDFILGFVTPIIRWFLTAILLHGLSNCWHILYELIRRGRVRYIECTYKQSDE